MKPTQIIIAGILIGIAVALLYGSNAIAFVANAYPQDRLRAAALDRCSEGNPRFVRFSERDRDLCYAQAHLSATASAR